MEDTREDVIFRLKRRVVQANVNEVMQWSFHQQKSERETERLAVTAESDAL